MKTTEKPTPEVSDDDVLLYVRELFKEFQDVSSGLNDSKNFGIVPQVSREPQEIIHELEKSKRIEGVTQSPSAFFRPSSKQEAPGMKTEVDITHTPKPGGSGSS